MVGYVHIVRYADIVNNFKKTKKFNLTTEEHGAFLS